MSGKQFLAQTATASMNISRFLRSRLLATAAATLLFVSCSLLQASETTANWSAFRNGGASTVAGPLPQQWSPSEGIAWQVETDGYGQSAPIIFDGRVYVTSVIGESKDTSAITAFDLSTGKKLWQFKVASVQSGPSNYMNSRAAPTPVADVDGVYAFFETGNLIALDHDGNERWQRDLVQDFGRFESNHGLGSSLAQTEDFLILNVEHKGPSALMAVDKRSGDDRWKTERPSGSSWTTPVVVGESRQVIVSSAGSLTGYEASSGEEIWKQPGLEGNTVPSPCVAGRNIFVGARIPEFGSAAEAARSNLCITTDNATPQIEWRAENAVCDYASPVVDGDQVYFLNKVGVLTCVNAKTGKEIYRQRLRAECWATPVVAENGIYFFAKDGTVKVIQRGPEFAVISTNSMWDPKSPPQPESYKEASRSHGHGAHGGSADATHSKTDKHSASAHKKNGPKQNGHEHADAPKSEQRSHNHEGSQSRPAGRASGMIAAMMKGDSNGDGILQADEISADFRPMLKRVDTNGDGSLDQNELAAMAKSFAERRKNSQASSRDPIVYGVAAVPGAIVVRSGTRLYCVASTTPAVVGQESN